MKTVLGFLGREEKEREFEAAAPDCAEEAAPVRSLVTVSLPGACRPLAYYNDLFDLREGDPVFVSGKFAGVRGVVNSVTTKFKINPANYEKVVARPRIKLSGTFAPFIDKMVSFDPGALSPDDFRSWVKAPADESAPGFVLGEGYSFPLESFMEDDDVRPEVTERAVDLCNDGRVAYLSVRGGVGTAFVQGSRWYEVNFKFKNGAVSDMYCECPYAGLCKHNLAVLITLRELLKKFDRENFTAITRGLFFETLSFCDQPVTV